jgi:hypothetical protein
MMWIDKKIIRDGKEVASVSEVSGLGIIPSVWTASGNNFLSFNHKTEADAKNYAENMILGIAPPV